MDKLIIKATQATPKVDFNGDEGHFIISGKSYPENVNSFYEPLFDYVERFSLNPQNDILLEFKWLYYNTASSKIIIKLIMMLKKIGGSLKVKWYCKEDFDLMIEKGVEIMEVLQIDLEIVYVKSMMLKGENI